MATSKLPDIGYKQVGQNLNVKIGEGESVESVTVKGTKEVLEPVKNKIKEYMTKKVKTTLGQIYELLKPKTTQEKKEKEKKKEAIKAEIKSNKNKIKELPKQKINKKKEAKEVVLEKEEVVEIERELEKRLRYRGYKHPQTGKTWNGEKYV